MDYCYRNLKITKGDGTFYYIFFQSPSIINYNLMTEKNYGLRDYDSTNS